jgi:hypothetical protein
MTTPLFRGPARKLGLGILHAMSHTTIVAAAAAKEYGLAIVHAALTGVLVAAAVAHVCWVIDGHAHIGAALLPVFVALGAFATLSLCFPTRLRGIFFGMFASIMLLNAIADLSRFGLAQDLRASYGLELAVFLTSVVCVGITIVRRPDFPAAAVGWVG